MTDTHVIKWYSFPPSHDFFCNKINLKRHWVQTRQLLLVTVLIRKISRPSSTKKEIIIYTDGNRFYEGSVFMECVFHLQWNAGIIIGKISGWIILRLDFI